MGDEEVPVSLFAQMFAAVRMSVIATRPDGKIIYWNAFAEELYGWNRHEALGQNIINLMVPADGLESAKDIFSRFNAGKAWTGEFKVKRKNGSHLRIVSSGAPIYTATGKLAAIIGISNTVAVFEVDGIGLGLARQIEGFKAVLSQSQRCDGQGMRLKFLEGEMDGLKERLIDAVKRIAKLENEK